LWRRTIPTDKPVPLLDPDMQQLIRASAPQSRIQLDPVSDRLPAFWYLDMRLAYLALVGHLPVGPVEHLVARPGHAPILHRRGQAARYRISFRAPEGWAHLGAFPVQAEGHLVYPHAAPSVWVDAAELETAFAHGWRAVIHEALLFQRGRPLDTWAARLDRCRQHATRSFGVIPDTDTDPDAGDIAALVGRGLRALALFTIGAMHTDRHLITHAVQTPGEVPAHSWEVERRGGWWTWTERTPVGTDAAQAQHPEWSAAVWARCRRRLLCGPLPRPHQPSDGWMVDGHAATGAWHLPREWFVACRTDALYLTGNPGWPDDGRPGAWRVKGALTSPQRAPKTLTVLSALRSRAEASWGRAEAPTGRFQQEA
jgi:hypothetical protein